MRKSYCAQHSIWQVFKALWAGLIGVQSQRNMEKDFAQGKLTTYLVAAIIFVLLLISSVLLLIHWIVN